MASKTEKTAKVFVFENVWKDRHWDEGTNVKVFATKKKAMDYFKKDVRNYLTNYDALNGDELDLSMLDSINGDGIDEEMTLADLDRLIKCEWLDINVDSEGTYASWSVTQQEVL